MLLLAGCSPATPGADSGERVLVNYVTFGTTTAKQAGAAESGYLGIIKGDRETELGFKIGGIIESIGPGPGKEWEQGAQVLKDAVLARLVQNDFSNQMASALVKARQDRNEYQRARQLYETKAIAIQDLERQEAASKSSEASLAMARQALADSTVAAPFAGTILSRTVRAGETVAAGQVLLRLADLANMVVEAGVPDTIVARLKVGDRCPIAIAALGGQILEGIVTEVGVAARPDDGLFKVALKIPNTKGALKSGMTASVLFNAGDRQPGGARLLVPLTALVTLRQDGQEKLAVFVLSDQHIARRKAIKTGAIIDTGIEVLDGLNPGERIAITGVANLFDDARVDAQPAAPALPGH